MLRYDWTVGQKSPTGYSFPGQGFFSGGAFENWHPAGRSQQGVFSLPSMDPTAPWPLPDDSQYYFYVRVWLADKYFKIFRSDGVQVRARGPQLKAINPRVLDGQLVKNVDFWNGTAQAPSNVSVLPYVDLEYQAQNTAVALTWEWTSVTGWDGLFTSTEQVRRCTILCYMSSIR